MGKRNYKVIVEKTTDEYSLGRITGIISALINDKTDFLSDSMNAHKNKFITVNDSKILVINVCTTESVWKQIRDKINYYYPKFCTFMRVYDTWLEEKKS